MLGTLLTLFSTTLDNGNSSFLPNCTDIENPSSSQKENQNSKYIRIKQWFDIPSVRPLLLA